MRGRGFMDWANKANNFLQKSKLLSNVGNVLGNLGVPYAGQIGSTLGSLGYGRHRRGHGIRLAGGRRLRY